MRVLMLSSSWPLRDGDYRGSFVSDLCRELATRGMTIDVCVPAPVAGRVPDGFGAAAGIPGLSVHWLPGLIPIRSRAFHGSGIESNIARHPMSLLSAFPTLGALAAESSLLVPFADVIVSNWLIPMGAVGSTLAGIFEKPHLVIAHSAPPTLTALPGGRSLIRSIIGSARSVACVSDSVRRRTASVAGPDLESRLCVQHLGIDLRPVVARRRSDKKLNLAFVGRLVHLKGADILIRAMAGVPGCRLTVAGDGPEAPSLRRLAGLLGVDVDFTGELDREATRRRMALSDVLVVPSRRSLFGREEGLPRVMLEAWACGVPVIASRSGGMVEAAAGCGGCLFFEPGDEKGLRSLLQGLTDDPDRLEDLSTGAMASATAFDAGAAADEWMDWICRACS